jgi:hypothetical protein
VSRSGVLRRAGSTPHEPDLQPASQLSLSDALAPRRQRSRSIRSRPSMRRVPVSALRASAQMPVARSRRRLCLHPKVPSSLRDVHRRGRRSDQIPIAPAAGPVQNFPRLRALALFGRRSVEPAEPPRCRRPKTCTRTDSCIAARKLYSITSSARTSNEDGTLRPSALAVLILMISSNLVGRCTGSSDGLVPLSILST